MVFVLCCTFTLDSDLPFHCGGRKMGLSSPGVPHPLPGVMPEFLVLHVPRGQGRSKGSH